MIRRLMIASAALLALSSAGCDDPGPATGTGGAKPTEVTFSVLSTENSTSLQALWAPFLEDMEKQTGLEVRPFFGSNYTALIEAMRAGQVQVGWFSNNSGLQAVRRAEAEVFARTTDPSGTDGYYSILMVGAKSPLTLQQVLRCDRSLQFGFGDAQSTSGTLAPITYLFAPRNIDPQRCFRTVRSANHEANMVAVANGLLDVATGNTTSFERATVAQPGLTERLKVIWRSPALPEDPIIWRKDLDPAVKERIRQFVLTYGRGEGPEAERQRRVIYALNIGGFRAADDTHLLPVREIEATSQLLQARNKRDSAAVARAEQALADVREERAEAQARAGLDPEEAADPADPTAPAPGARE